MRFLHIAFQKVQRLEIKVGLGIVLLLILLGGANTILAYRQYAELKQNAQSAIFAYSWKLHSVLSVSAEEVEQVILYGSGDPKLRVSIYECDHNSDGEIDDPYSIVLANTIDQRRFIDEFSSKCGRPKDKAQHPYFWVYAQRSWSPWLGNIIGIQSINFTDLESSQFWTFDTTLVVDEMIIATIASCSKERFQRCTPSQDAIKRFVNSLSLPYDHLTLIIIENGERRWQDGKACSSFALSELKQLGCLSYRFTNIENGLVKTNVILSATPDSAQPILILLTKNLTMADARAFIQTNALDYVYLIGVDSDKMYAGFVRTTEDKYVWFEHKLTDLVSEEGESLLPFEFEYQLYKLEPHE